MTEAEFLTELYQARKKIRELPIDRQGPLLALLQQTEDRYAQIKKNCTRARIGLDDLRILMKYLIFDCEATMRELARSPDES